MDQLLIRLIKLLHLPENAEIRYPAFSILLELDIQSKNPLIFSQSIWTQATCVQMIKDLIKKKSFTTEEVKFITLSLKNYFQTEQDNFLQQKDMQEEITQLISQIIDIVNSGQNVEEVYRQQLLLLSLDHAKVRTLFKKLDSDKLMQLRDEDRKQLIAQRIDALKDKKIIGRLSREQCLKAALYFAIIAKPNRLQDIIIHIHLY